MNIFPCTHTKSHIFTSLVISLLIFTIFCCVLQLITLRTIEQESRCLGLHLIEVLSIQSSVSKCRLFSGYLVRPLEFLEAFFGSLKLSKFWLPCWMMLVYFLCRGSMYNNNFSFFITVNLLICSLTSRFCNRFHVFNE